MNKFWRIKKMKLQKNKMLITVALIMILTFSALTAIIPLADAHTPAWNVPTYAYLSVAPNLVQANHYTQLVMFLNLAPPTAGGNGGDRWRNFMINVTAPDGTKSQLGPFTSEQLGSQFTTYTPTAVGNYTLVFYWPGQVLANGAGVPNPAGFGYVGDFFEPAVSDPVTLSVQSDPITVWQEPPLPTGMWSRPINGENRGWSTLASNWLRGGWLINNLFQSEGQAPASSHIVWTRPVGYLNGGIADQQWPGIAYGMDDYENEPQSPIIMDGRAYFNTAVPPLYGFYCVDLATGKQLWYNNGSALPYMTNYGGGGGFGPALAQAYPQLGWGQIYHYHSANGDGIIAYLWAYQVWGDPSVWYMLDANTGNLILTLINVPGGFTVTDQDGSLLRYSYDPVAGQLLCWNSSQTIPPASPTGTGFLQWKPRTGAVIDAQNDTSWTQGGPNPPFWGAADILPRSGYTLNVTAPAGLPGGINQVVVNDNRVPQEVIGSSFDSTTEKFSVWALSLKPGSEGNLLWSKDYTNPRGGNLTLVMGAISYDSGAFTIFSQQTRQFWGYSLTDGALLWGPTDPMPAWDYYLPDVSVSYISPFPTVGWTTAYGNLYAAGYGGVLYCYDIKTGVLKWTYTAPTIGYESPYGNYPLRMGAIADGKLYLYDTEHSPKMPLWRGSSLRILDAKSGKEITKVLTYGPEEADAIAVADGYLLMPDLYTQQYECFGKGPTATTVTATPKTVPSGSNVLIEGTVADQSSGAMGTPAIADQYMASWMEYLYMQQAKPNANGVPVTLQATDSTGKTTNIGTATSDINGQFKIAWTPPNDGLFTITASFTGSSSY
jgi:hypothetical protein